MGKRKIYIVLTDTGTFFTRLIRLYTKSPFNHVSIAFDYYLKNMYSFGRKKPNNPFIGGFVRESRECRLFKRADCEVYSILVTEREYGQIVHSIHRLAANEKQYKYNLLGLFAIIFNRDFNRKHAYFCSQFVATLFNKCGRPLSEKSPNLTTPEDIRNSNELHLEYEGPLIAYPFSPKKQLPVARSYPFYIHGRESNPG